MESWKNQKMFLFQCLFDDFCFEIKTEYLVNKVLHFLGIFLLLILGRYHLLKQFVLIVS